MDPMPGSVNSMDPRGYPSRVMSSHGGSGIAVVGAPSRVMSNAAAGYSSAHGGGSLLLGGGTTYAVPTGGGHPARGPADVDYVPVKLGTVGGRVDGGPQSQSAADCDGWNPRASMAFDSAKGLLNPVGENNCFLNSAVQVCQQQLSHYRVYNHQ